LVISGEVIHHPDDNASPKSRGVERPQYLQTLIQGMSATQLTVLLADQSPSKTYAYLKKQSVESLAAVSDHDFLELLNPAIHSLQYLFILYALPSLFSIATKLIITIANRVFFDPLRPTLREVSVRKSHSSLNVSTLNELK
jgi:hypothetical protein